MTQSKPQREVSPEEAAYYEDLAKLRVQALWTLPNATAPVPRPMEIAHLWKWEELYPQLQRSSQFVGVGASEAERRVLTLKNPGLPPMAAGATQTLVASLQMLLPGEVAPAHRHNFNALRFILEGEGAYTTVDGEKIPMQRGDLLLTPNWQWHDHGNDGKSPVVWFDGLDFPFVWAQRSTFFEDMGGKQQEESRKPGQSHRRYGAGTLVRARKPEKSIFSPVNIFPWKRAYEALLDLQKHDLDEHDGALLEYVNPLTGGHVLPTIACYLRGLPAGFHTKARRQTTGTIHLVVSGSGSAIIGGKRFEWSERDIFVTPGWTHCEYIADKGKDVVLFQMDDLPMQEPFGIYREELA